MTITPLTTIGAATECALRIVTSSSEELSERAIIDLVVDGVLAAHPGGARVDSWAIADEFVLRRVSAGRDPDPRQTLDYIQHLFRETADHVCRHADGHHYVLHPEPKCGPGCDERHRHADRTVTRDHCDTCFLELTTDGQCPLGC